jgi:hypothetical protein
MEVNLEWFGARDEGVEADVEFSVGDEKRVAYVDLHEAFLGRRCGFGRIEEVDAPPAGGSGGFHNPEFDVFPSGGEVRGIAREKIGFGIEGGEIVDSGFELGHAIVEIVFAAHKEGPRPVVHLLPALALLVLFKGELAAPGGVPLVFVFGHGKARVPKHFASEIGDAFVDIVTENDSRPVWRFVGLRNLHITVGKRKGRKLGPQ